MTQSRIREAEQHGGQGWVTTGAGTFDRPLATAELGGELRGETPADGARTLHDEPSTEPVLSGLVDP